jgi:hypothetical protein
MSKLMIALFVAAGLGFAGSSMAQTNAPTATPTAPDVAPTPMLNNNDDAVPTGNAAPKGKVRVAKDEAAAIAKCDQYSGPAKETCISNAKGLQDTPLDKCDGFAGAAKDACLGNAKAWK